MAGSLPRTGVVPDVRADFLIQLLKEKDVLSAVLLHLLLSEDVAVVDLDPERHTLVFELAAQSEERSNEAQSVHEEAELLHGFEDVDRSRSRWRRQAGKEELAFELPEVVLVAVIGDDSLGLCKGGVSKPDHLFVAVLPFGVHRDLLVTLELQTYTEEAAVLDDLLRSDILLPRLPDVGLRRLPFDI